MAVSRTIFCDGPDCGSEHEGGQPCHVTTATPPPHIPQSFIETRERLEGEDYIHHFCGWTCLMKFAAAKPMPVRIEWDDIVGGADGD